MHSNTTKSGSTLVQVAREHACTRTHMCAMHSAPCTMQVPKHLALAPLTLPSCWVGPEGDGQRKYQQQGEPGCQI